MDLIVSSEMKDYYDEETKIIKMPDCEIDLEPQGMGYILYNSLKQHRGKTALIDLVKKQTITYEDLLKLSIRTSIKLKNLNLIPGDIITVFSPNQINSLAVFFSAFLSGFVNANLDPTLPDEDLEHLIAQVETRIYFVSKECEERLERILSKLGIEKDIVVFGKSEGNLMYDEFICEQDGEENFEVYEAKDLDEMCLIMFSSGTTGLPKGMVYSQRSYVFHSYFCINGIDNSMSLSNIYWIGAIQTALSQIRSGGTYTFSSKFSPAKLWDDIKTYKIDLLQLHPHAALEFIEKKPENWNGKLSSIAVLGSSISEVNLKKIRDALPKTRVVPVYGMSETLVLLNPHKYYEKLGSVGVPKQNIHYKIVDIYTEENLSFNQPGELRVKSPYQITSYYKKDSSDIRDEDGFLKTGDIAYFDEEFSFFVVDRVKDIFKYKGVHINPGKYEKILERHPDVQMAVLVGVPHEIEGSHILAVVVLKEGRSLSSNEVEDFYNERTVEAAKIRAGVTFVDALPMTATGKIMRKKLKEMILEKKLNGTK